jgi:valyl-tRNA synthetase
MAEAARALREFFWSEFCDWFVEMCKPALRGGEAEAGRARQTLWFVLEGALRALHPFMPFITEEIWQKLPGTGEALMVAQWPGCAPAWRDESVEQEMAALMEVVVAGRASRAKQLGAPGQEASLSIQTRSAQVAELARSHRDQILLLTGCKAVAIGDDLSHEDAAAEITHPFGEETVVRFSATLSQQDMERIGEQLRKNVARLEKEEQSLRSKLGSPGFVERAPADVVEKTKARLDRVVSERQAAEAQLRAAAVMKGLVDSE